MSEEGRELVAEATVIKAADLGRVLGRALEGSEETPVRVTFERTEDVVRAIRVHCRCGETIVLRCEYDEEEASS